MLKNTHVQHYKSLFDVSVDLEPLTVFIGPNGSGKSSFCEALDFFSKGLNSGILSARPIVKERKNISLSISMDISQALRVPSTRDPGSRFSLGNTEKPLKLSYGGTLTNSAIYDFVPTDIASYKEKTMSSSGAGIANSLTKILFDNRDLFVELENRFTELVPNISRIKLDQDKDRETLLFLVDRYSDYAIPASQASDGTLRILAFLTALYEVSQPGLICFEEPENGIHPWLLNKLIQLLHKISTEGINGKPSQIIITTHSPVLLNYVKPEQIRAVELDDKGRTKISALPLESKRFQAAMDAYDGELGELWFTNIFGGNPE